MMMMIIKLIINQWAFPEHLLCTPSISYALSHLALKATPNIMPNFQTGRLRLKEGKSPSQVRGWRQCCHSSGGLFMKKIILSESRVHSPNRKEWSSQGRFLRLLALMARAPTWVPGDRGRSLSQSANISEVQVSQPAVDMQLPSSKNKIPEISHIILLELLTHIRISSPEMHFWCSKNKRGKEEEGIQRRWERRVRFQMILHNRYQVKKIVRAKVGRRRKDPSDTKTMKEENNDINCFSFTEASFKSLAITIKSSLHLQSQ